MMQQYIDHGKERTEKTKMSDYGTDARKLEYVTHIELTAEMYVSNL